MVAKNPKPREHKSTQSLKDARMYAHTKICEHASSEIAKEIENSILKYTQQMCEIRKIKEIRWSDVNVRRIYIRKMRMVLQNIHNLLEMIEKKEIVVCEVAFKNHQEINPGLWDVIIDKIARREKLTELTDAEVDNDSYVGLLKCTNEECNSWNTRFVEFQTRSSDEPLTVFMRCIDCGVHATLRN